MTLTRPPVIHVQDASFVIHLLVPYRIANRTFRRPPRKMPCG